MVIISHNFLNSNLKARQLYKGLMLSKPVLLTLIIFFYIIGNAIAIPKYELIKDSLPTSTQQQAIALINKIKELPPSNFWPNISPDLFLQNIKSIITQPISIYAGKGTNFCGYGALTYLLLQDDPLSYTKFLLELYREGKSKFGNTVFDPSPAIKKEAGLLKFKGILDIHPAEQMWYLTLAGHYKGYLNLFNRKYDPGDEDRFWASVNYAKFNRMVRQFLHFKAKARGADLIRPKVGDLYVYIEEKMKTGTIVLFINNRIVHKKNHVTIKLGVPTHFIVLEKISKENNTITLMYWDYGRKTQLQLSTAFFKRIVFGITYFTKKGNDVN